MRLRHIIAFIALIPWCHAQGAVTFNRDIRPILSQKCFQCHGPDAQTRKAKLRLDQTDSEDGAYRIRRGTAAIKPGNIEESAVWERITTTDPDDIMPPPESKKEPLTAEEQALFREWIEAGAPYEGFWAFETPTAPELPQPNRADWSSQPIDRFVLARLESEGLEPSTKASKRTLIRRVTFDLTGLPPTPEEIHTFLEDSSATAYENLVERLLAKPQYGEHMAKYWLDLVRFADTNGLHHDHYREMTPYRDWVIRAFNDNLSFDQFTRYQIAGDLFPEPSTDQQIASGFNRLHLIIDRGTALPEESFTRNVVDRVVAVGTAFMGLTVQCASCHDHKYDPLTQKDFYQLFAFFNNFDGGPETGGRSGNDFRRGLQPPYINLPSPAQSAELARLDAALQTATKEHAKRKDAEKDQDQSPELKALAEALKQRQTARDAFERTIPATLVMKERKEIRPAHILIRGVYDQKGDEVERNTPAFLPPMQSSDSVKSRMDFANWLVAPANPLTARVTVNRFWQQFFGVGIVKTSEDFGAQGELPSHPKLLDHLTTEFVTNDWDVKRLVRSIVLSETYQQTSRATSEAYINDPENRLLARGPRFRLDSEMIRDQILAVSGLLNRALHGKSVKPPQPKNIWTTVVMPSSYPKVYEPDQGADIVRRSVYTFWKRAIPPPQMTILDAPTREACIARRERTNTPLQALLLMNEEQYFQAAAHCAHIVLEEASESDSDRLAHAYEVVTSQQVDADESQMLLEALAAFRAHFEEDGEAAAKITEPIIGTHVAPEESAELAAWSMLVHSLLNLDVTKTRQ